MLRMLLGIHHILTFLKNMFENNIRHKKPTPGGVSYDIAHQLGRKDNTPLLLKN